MKRQLLHTLNERIQDFVDHNRSDLHDKARRKRELCSKRKVDIIKVNANAQVRKVVPFQEEKQVHYYVHLTYLLKQDAHFYVEEEVEERIALFVDHQLVEDLEVFKQEEEFEGDQKDKDDERVSFHYDRRKAVQYAEYWWNSYNPAYKSFEVDCTNFISQCLHAGGAPMRGHPNRGKGWWMRNNNWSYSWSVANSLRWHLPSSNVGLRGVEVQYPQQLQLGDVICYDFEGDGRFDHNTIVTAKDAYGMPLVNAHTTNSRMRYWNYEDSTAYTPEIQYKFYRIEDDS
ncbi:amidase domain-containing protein [Rossellomorea sp. BNER]|uniref:amidase domain-containing protein n=1 Tax=Rossellomorea sp. BNER TaxID=2962031 RepID=UPI003AF2DFF2|nr:amidase domain-containing protein [Rossellomorea sp. BNER]